MLNLFKSTIFSSTKRRSPEEENRIFYETFCPEHMKKIHALEGFANNQSFGSQASKSVQAAATPALGK